MKHESKIVILLVSTLPLLVAWFFVDNIESKYDWFLLIDFEQTPKWYAHYSAGYVSTILLTYIIYLLSKEYLSKKLQIITLVFLIFSIFRLAMYWLLRFNVPMLPIIICLMIFSLTYYYIKR